MDSSFYGYNDLASKGKWFKRDFSNFKMVAKKSQVVLEQLGFN